MQFHMNKVLQATAIPLLTAYLLFSPLSIAQQESKNALPNIGNAAVSTLSLEKERQYGDIMLRQMRASQPMIHDPVLVEYVNDLGNQLVKHADNVNYSFNFFLINNKDINAFAFFGGNVGIHTGLITLADEESELASVIAHEISHVTQRHLARKLESNNRNSPLTTAGLISSVLLTLVNPQLGMAALQTTMAASQQANINYTRINEKEADRVGISLLARSGFNPASAAHFFGKLSEKYRYASKPPAMLLTHPLPESRIADVRNRVQNFPSKLLPPSLDFELAKARIIARYETKPQDNIKQSLFNISKQRYVYRAAIDYGLAISYFEDKQYDQAEQLLLKLLKDDSRNLFYVDVLTDVYIKQKQFDKALTMLESLNKLMPNNRVISLNYANAAYEAGELNLAVNLLQDFLIAQPNSFIAHDLLANVYDKQGNKPQFHSAKAEVYALLGAYPRAIDELQMGYKNIDDEPLLQKRFKARISQFQQKKEVLERL